jgi:hypothetical protein
MRIARDATASSPRTLTGSFLKRLRSPSNIAVAMATIACGAGTLEAREATLQAESAATKSVQPVSGATDAALPDGRALVERAMRAMGVMADTTTEDPVASFESVSTFDTPMGAMRIDYSFIAATATQPAACKVVQTNAAVNAAFEMGTANGVAWMGESGRFRPADARMTNELLGGSDVQLLLRSLLTRFEQFTTKAMETIDGKSVWVVTMQPKAARNAPRSSELWTLRLDATSGLPTSFDTPIAQPPNAPLPNGNSGPATNNAAPSIQRTELSDWKPIELGDKASAKANAALAAQAPIAFRQAVRTVSGMKITMRYEKVAMNTLETGSITAPSLVVQPETAKKN